MAKSILSDFLEYSKSSPSGLAWKVDRSSRAKKGSSAGWMDKTTGYHRIGFKGKCLWAHRVIWELHHGEIKKGMQVDHINGNKVDNRIENLRIADASENKCNVALRSDNAAGFKGLYWNGHLGLWVGEVVLYKKRLSKTSVDRSVVEEWLVDTRSRLHGEYARHS